MSRTESRIWISLFVVLLAIPVALGLAGFRSSERSFNPQSEPEFDPSSFLDDEYFAEVESYVVGVLPGREAALRARAAIDYELLGDSTLPASVIAGDRDTLFWREYFDLACPDSPLDVRPDGETPLYVLLTVPKWVVYSERVPDHLVNTSCWEPARERQLLALSNGATTVDELPTLRDARDRDEEVFLAGDTHWNSYGAALVSRDVLAAIDPSYADRAIEAGDNFPWKNNLLWLLGYDGIEDDRQYSISGGGDVTVLSRQVTDIAGELPVRVESAASGTDVIPGTTVLVGDSQMAHSLEELQPHFERLVYLNLIIPSLVGPSAFDALPAADRVIFGSVLPNADLNLDLMAASPWFSES